MTHIKINEVKTIIIMTIKLLQIYETQYSDLYLENIEVLSSIVKILAPITLKSDKKHVRCKLSETCQGETRLASFFKTVIFCHCVKSLEITIKIAL